MGHLEDQKPQGAKDALGRPLFRLYAPAYQPAIDAQGNADCQNGQNGYPNGELNTARYRQGNIEDHSNAQGLPIPSQVGTAATAAITDNNLPGLSGGTYKSRSSASTTWRTCQAPSAQASSRSSSWACSPTSASRRRTRSRTRTSSRPSSTT